VRKLVLLLSELTYLMQGFGRKRLSSLLKGGGMVQMATHLRNHVKLDLGL
jgi:hypothetical protein